MTTNLPRLSLVLTNNPLSHDVKFMGKDIPITGMTLLGIFGGLEILTAWKGISLTTDYAGHFGGIAAGMAAAWYIRRQAAKKEMTRTDLVPDSSVETS